MRKYFCERDLFRHKPARAQALVIGLYKSAHVSQHSARQLFTSLLCHFWRFVSFASLFSVLSAYLFCFNINLWLRALAALYLLCHNTCLNFQVSEISLMSGSIFQRSNCYNSIINTFFLIKVPHIRQLRPIHLAPYTNSDIDNDTIRYVNVLSTHNLVSRKLSFCASVCVMNPHLVDLLWLNLSFQDWASVL